MGVEIGNFFFLSVLRIHIFWVLVLGLSWNRQFKWVSNKIYIKQVGWKKSQLAKAITAAKTPPIICQRLFSNEKVGNRKN